MPPPGSAPPAPIILKATFGDTDTRAAEISTAEMRNCLADGRTLTIDCRIRPQFDAGHIPGASCLDAPAERQVETVVGLVGGDRSAPLVVYCNGPNCQQSRRLGDELISAGFTDVRRYQLGISVWRVLGGPTAVALGWVEHVADHDETAVLVDVRPADLFRAGSLPRARNAPIDAIGTGKLTGFGMPHDDFNRRVILFGSDAAEARRMAEYMGNWPWSNVSYAECSFAELAHALR